MHHVASQSRVPPWICKKPNLYGSPQLRRDATVHTDNCLPHKRVQTAGTLTMNDNDNERIYWKTSQEPSPLKALMVVLQIQEMPRNNFTKVIFCKIGIFFTSSTSFESFHI